METWRSHPFLGALIPEATARPETCASFPVHAVLLPGSGSPKTPQPARCPGSGGNRLRRTSMPAESDPEGGSQDGCERARAPSCGAARPAGEPGAPRRAPAPDPGRYRTRDCSPPCRRYPCETAKLARWRARAEFSALAGGRSAVRARKDRAQPGAPRSETTASYVQCRSLGPTCARAHPAQATRASGASPATLRRHTSRRRTTGSARCHARDLVYHS